MKGWLAGCRQKGRLMAGWLDGWKDGRVMHGGQVDGSRVSQEHTDCSRVYWGMTIISTTMGKNPLEEME